MENINYKIISEEYGTDVAGYMRDAEMDAAMEEGKRGLTKRLTAMVATADRMLEEDGRIADRTYLALNRAAMAARASGMEARAIYLGSVAANG